MTMLLLGVRLTVDGQFSSSKTRQYLDEKIIITLFSQLKNFLTLELNSELEKNKNLRKRTLLTNWEDASQFNDWIAEGIDCSCQQLVATLPLNLKL